MIDPERLVSAYASGWFPMAVEGGEIRWFSPDPRGIIPLDTFQISNRLARTWRSGRFEIAIDRSFGEVMAACATVVRDPSDPGTWISPEIVDSYTALHRLGAAHSVEAWRGGQLVGGLYGVALGGVFFGESMFHRETDASKIALVALVERLTARGFELLDTQWWTPHLEQFGATQIPRRDYLRRLDRALRSTSTFV
ncbi:MAG: leucyl/phenylalanyl-tRNA--protein transferase [Vicinamibacterales bacterium]